MSARWTAETILAAAVDEARDRITVHGTQVRIDGRPANGSELRLIAELVHGGLIDLATKDKRPGARCCWATSLGRRQARRWARYRPLTLEGTR